MICVLMLWSFNCFLCWCEAPCQHYFVLYCQGGVQRVHLLDGTKGGVLLLELFKRDGMGTMVARYDYHLVKNWFFNCDLCPMLINYVLIKRCVLVIGRLNGCLYLYYHYILIVMSHALCLMSNLHFSRFYPPVGWLAS
jgi:hypothetical protein